MLKSQKYLRIRNEQVRFDIIHLKNQKFETKIFYHMYTRWYYCEKDRQEFCKNKSYSTNVSIAISIVPTCSACLI